MCQKDFRKIPSFPVTIASTMPVKTMAAWHTGYQNMDFVAGKTQRLCGKIQLRNGIGPCSKKKSKPDLEIRDFAIQVKSKCLRFCRRKVLCWDIIWTYICVAYTT